MDLLLLIALVTFAAGAVVAAVQNSWALALVAVGLFVVTLSESGVVKV